MEWVNIKDKLPDDNQMCWITNGEAMTTTILGLIPYKVEAKGWMDLFATYEAGSLYGLDVITHWCDEKAIPAPQDEE